MKSPAHKTCNLSNASIGYCTGFTSFEDLNNTVQLKPGDEKTVAYGVFFSTKKCALYFKKWNFVFVS